MKNMKEVAGSLFRSAAPSVRKYLKIRSMWSDIMKITTRRGVLDLSSLTVPLGVYDSEIHIGTYSPAVANAILRYKKSVLESFDNAGFHFDRLVVKVLSGFKVEEDNDKAVKEEVEYKFSENEIEKASQMFSLIGDEDLRRRLAILWLKSRLKRGG